MIDFNKPITKDDLDLDAYNEKFKTAEKFLGKILTDEDESEYVKLLYDKTTFAYLKFKLNEKPVRLYPYQDVILNNDHKFKIFRAARQIGKSMAFDIKVAYNLCVDHGYEHNECIVSKSLEQAKFQMTRIRQLLNSANFEWKEDRGPQDNMTTITISVKDDEDKVKYVNRCVITPHTESALGYDFHEVNLDEMEYWVDVDLNHFYHNIIEPTTYHTKGSISIFSNPNGADNFVADLEKEKLPNGDSKWHVYVFSFLDCPINTEEDLEEKKLGKTRQQIESQLLAIRSISSKNYFTPEEIERSFDPNLTELKMVGKQPFFAMDVGSKHDQSVLVGGFVEPDEENENFKHVYVPIIHCYPVGYPLNRVVGSEVDESDGWHYEKSVKDYLEEWGKDGTMPIFSVDVTGNSGIIPLFEAIGIYPQDVVFSGPAKSGFYQRLKYYLEKGLLHRVKSNEFEYQFSHLEMRKSKRGYLLIHHEKEDDLDDVPDAIAALVHSCDDPNIVPPSLKVI